MCEETYDLDDLNCDPCEPESDDLVTTDHVHFYCSGKLAFTVPDDLPLWDAIDRWCDDHGFYPTCWFVSDHGNAHILSRC